MRRRRGRRCHRAGGCFTMNSHRVFCKHCGYPLAGLAHSVCPECGESFNPNLRRSFSRHPRLRTWRRGAIASLVILVSAYVASYYCLVQPLPLPMPATTVIFSPLHNQPRSVRVSGSYQILVAPNGSNVVVLLQPTYRAGGELATLLFRPMHALDRAVRPGTWSAPLPSRPFITVRPPSSFSLSPPSDFSLSPPSSYIWAGP